MASLQYVQSLKGNEQGSELDGASRSLECRFHPYYNISNKLKFYNILIIKLKYYNIFKQVIAENKALPDVLLQWKDSTVYSDLVMQGRKNSAKGAINLSL